SCNKGLAFRPKTISPHTLSPRSKVSPAIGGCKQTEKDRPGHKLHRAAIASPLSHGWDPQNCGLWPPKPGSHVFGRSFLLGLPWVNALRVEPAVRWRGSLQRQEPGMPMEQNSREDFNRAAKSAQKQIGDAEKKIGDAAIEAQNQFIKTLEEMSREAMACAPAELERACKLPKKLSEAHSVSDAVAAYKEWLSEEMSARSEDARRFMSNSQSFMTTGSRALTNGWSGVGMGT